MENAIIRVVADALQDDFWREDSEILQTYYEDGNSEIDCEGYSIDITGEETAKLTVGDKRYILRVEEEN